MSEQLKRLPVNPESIIYEWRKGTPDRLFALGRGDFDGRVFYYGFSYSRDLLHCQCKASIFSQFRGTVVVGVGLNKSESLRQGKVVFDSQTLGLWFLGPFKPEHYTGFIKSGFVEKIGGRDG